jgi:molybdopterin converting factor small subunit
MKVIVRFSGELRTLAGSHSMQLYLNEGQSLRDLLLALSDITSSQFNNKVTRPLLNGAGPYTLVMVNTNSIQAESELDTPLADGDIIAFVPPMEGGSSPLSISL